MKTHASSDPVAELRAFLVTLAQRLPEHFASVRPSVQHTDGGRLVIRAGDLRFWRDERDGEPVACRLRGGRAEFAHVEPDGRMVWQRWSRSAPQS